MGGGLQLDGCVRAFLQTFGLALLMHSLICVYKEHSDFGAVRAKECFDTVQHVLGD